MKVGYPQGQEDFAGLPGNPQTGHMIHWQVDCPIYKWPNARAWCSYGCIYHYAVKPPIIFHGNVRICCPSQGTMETQLMDRHWQLQVRGWMRYGEMVKTQMCTPWHHQSGQWLMTDSTTTSLGRIPNPVHTSNLPGKITADGFSTLMCCWRSVRDWWVFFL